MSITLVNATSLLRSLIGEATAKFWTDAEVTLYLQMAMAKACAQYNPWLFSRNKNVVDFGVIAGTSDYDMVTDGYKLSHIQIKTSGRKLRYINEDEYYKYAEWTAGNPVVWTWVGNKVRVIPTPSATDTDYLLAWYIKNLDEITDFPDSLRALIVVEAAILARTKNEDVTSDILMLKKDYEQAVLVDLQMTNESDLTQFADFSEEDSMA
jgi:hypothetical protein